MAKIKFQIGDKVRFQTTNSDFGYLKGHTGIVKYIDSTPVGRALYKVTYKHAVTGKERWSYFTSKDLEKSSVDCTPIEKAINTEVLKQETHEQNKSWGSWDEFCESFKGELFK